MQTNGQTQPISFVDLAAQYKAIETEINQAISKVLHQTNFILGEEVALFEQAFAAYCETNYAVGVDSGTSALELALRAFDIGPGDEVITVANSFIATVLAISYAGATPVLVDIDPETYTMDASQLEASITPRTKAIIPVHLYGQPADMDPILEIAARNNLVVIEDACQAHGSRYKGQRVGSLGHAAAFSFYPAKNLGAYGDGGIVVTNDATVAERIRMLRNYGQSEKYHHHMIGFNRRLDTLQAAVLQVKLKYLDSWNDMRRQHAQLYSSRLQEKVNSIVLPIQADYSESVYHLYVIRSERRDELKRYLENQHIHTGIHYPVPIHLQPAYKNLGYKKGDFPITEQYAAQILSLPLFPELNSQSIDYTTDAISAFDITLNLEPLVSQAVG